MHSHKREFMAEESRTDSLLDHLMKRSRMPWYLATAIATAVLLLFSILVAYLDGLFVSSTAISKWEFWRELLDFPTWLVWILMMYPYMRRLRDQAIHTFQLLLPLEDSVPNRLAAEVFVPNRRLEWGAVLIGAVFSLSVEQPWGWGWDLSFWLNVYEVVTFPLLFGLLFWLLYDTLTGTLYLSRLSRQDLRLDVFDTDLLTSITHSGLGISLTFLAGISVSLIFQRRESLLEWESITIYAVLVCAAVLAFFLSIWSAHRAIAQVKKRELALARKHLTTASREIKEWTEQGTLEGMERLSSTIALWKDYKELVQETPEWPFNASIIRRLAASTLVPAGVYLMKVFSVLGFRL